MKTSSITTTCRAGSSPNQVLLARYIQKECVYLGDMPVAVLDAAGTILFIHTDHLNTPRTITNAASQVVWRWDQAEPFGSDPANGNPSGLGAFEFNLRFPGQYFDKESNLHYNYFRNYDPAIGRYPQFDPIGLRGGINGYAYVDGNPLSYSDPLGLLNVVAQIGGSFVPGFGAEGSIGIYVTLPFFGERLDAGLYTSGGFGPGLNIGGGPQVGLIKGNESDIEGITRNVNGGLPGAGGIALFNENWDLVGFTVGPVAEAGLSGTYVKTGAVGLRDFFGWLFNKIGAKFKTCP